MLLECTMRSGLVIAFVGLVLAAIVENGNSSPTTPPKPASETFPVSSPRAPPTEECSPGDDKKPILPQSSAAVTHGIPPNRENPNLLDSQNNIMEHDASGTPASPPTQPTNLSSLQISSPHPQPSNPDVGLHREPEMEIPLKVRDFMEALQLKWNEFEKMRKEQIRKEIGQEEYEKRGSEQIEEVIKTEFKSKKSQIEREIVKQLGVRRTYIYYYIVLPKMAANIPGDINELENKSLAELVQLLVQTPKLMHLLIEEYNGKESWKLKQIIVKKFEEIHEKFTKEYVKIRKGQLLDQTLINEIGTHIAKQFGVDYPLIVGWKKALVAKSKLYQESDDTEFYVQQMDAQDIDAYVADKMGDIVRNSIFKKEKQYGDAGPDYWLGEASAMDSKVGQIVGQIQDDGLELVSEEENGKQPGSVSDQQIEDSSKQPDIASDQQIKDSSKQIDNVSDQQMEDSSMS